MIAPQLYTIVDAVCDWENIDVIGKTNISGDSTETSTASSIPTAKQNLQRLSPALTTTTGAFYPAAAAANSWGGLASGVDWL